MRSTIGWLLQLLGLLIVLLGLFVGISMGNSRTELIYLAVGVAAFYLGRWIGAERGR